MQRSQIRLQIRLIFNIQVNLCYKHLSELTIRNAILFTSVMSFRWQSFHPGDLCHFYLFIHFSQIGLHQTCKQDCITHLTPTRSICIVRVCTLCWTNKTCLILKFLRLSLNYQIYHQNHEKLQGIQQNDLAIRFQSNHHIYVMSIIGWCGAHTSKTKGWSRKFCLPKAYVFLLFLIDFFPCLFRKGKF